MKKNLRYGRSVMRTIFSATLLYTATVGAAQASIIAFKALSGGGSYGGVDATNNVTIGWAFTPTVNISVTSLGFWDKTPATDLNRAHDVGLWTLEGTLLVSTIIQTNSTLVNSFRYEAITGVNLTAGTSYLIGAYISRSLIDEFQSGSVDVAIDMASEITFNGAARSASDIGFAAAPTTPSTSHGRFGPNFQFTITPNADPDPSAAPEPFSLGLVGIGVACLAARRRRAA